MSIVADQLRPFWLSSLNEVAGNLDFGLAEWVRRGTFQITSEIQPDKFVLNIPQGNLALQRAFAFDAARMGMAAFESVGDLNQHPAMPKSLGWPIIKTYYATFFAAHALLRMFGIGLTQFNFEQISVVSKTAAIYSGQGEQKLAKGLYACIFSPQSGELICDYVGAQRGSHELLWKYFVNAISDFSTQMLETGASIKQQQAAIKLVELCKTLKHGGKNDGSWLSHVRNDANYKHEYGVWFPYSARSRYYSELEAHQNDWRQNPEDISIWSGPGKELRRFIDACNVILSVLNVTAIDMSKRCPVGKSFHHNTTLAVLNFLNK